MNRITLKRLKVADFASEETLCFAADVYFDGYIAARAHNDGHGGMTFVKHVNLGWYRAAVDYVASLPKEVTDIKDPKSPNGFFTWKRKLEDVVDSLASEMHDDKRIRAAFNRALKKVSFIMPNKNGKDTFYTSTAKLPADATARSKMLNAFVAKNPNAQFLNLMSEAAAYERFKQVAVQ